MRRTDSNIDIGVLKNLGHNIDVPEPTGVLAVAGLGLLIARRKRAAAV